MPEADTIDRVKSRKVQVANLPPADSGRGFALFDQISERDKSSHRMAKHDERNF